MELRLNAAERAVHDTRLYHSSFSANLKTFEKEGFDRRIVAGDPAASAVLHRMRQRDATQMPPLATE